MIRLLSLLTLIAVAAVGANAAQVDIDFANASASSGDPVVSSTHTGSAGGTLTPYETPLYTTGPAGGSDLAAEFHTVKHERVDLVPDTAIAAANGSDFTLMFSIRLDGTDNPDRKSVV